MTTGEYSEADRFPLTTWAGITAQTQALTDCCGLEELRAVRARWNKLTRLQRDRLAELEAKAARRHL
jgi:hypothetical protein